MKLAGKPGTGKPYAGFDAAGVGNVTRGAGLRPMAKALDEPPPDPTVGAPIPAPTCEGKAEWLNYSTTHAMFQTRILAYNLLVWMMWLTTKKGLRQEPNTIRTWLIKVPARLITSGRCWILKLPRDYFFKEQWENLDSSLMALCWA